MAFAHLEARAYELFETIYELCRYEDDFGQVYDDCTVALIGNRYQTIGYDSFEEDYYALTGYEQGLAQTESGKRLMRRTKAEIISIIGQCFGILIAFGGIGGFPLIWERLNGPGSCLWTSEIGEFPAAVTKKRFCGKERW